MNDWNPRYVAFAATHGRTPEAQLDADRVEWPGGVMAGFIIWISQRKEAFAKAHPEAMWNRHTIADQDAFTTYLTQETTP